MSELSKKSKYQLLADTLKEEILTLADGDLLDPEAKLIERFQASRNTLRSAMSVLRQERLIASRAGYGTYKLASGQAKFKKKSILAIMPSREESFWYQIMDGLHDALGSGTPYQLIYSYSGDDAEKISNLLSEAYHSDVAGVVLLALYEVDQVEILCKEELPKSTVLVHNCHPNFKGTFVGTKEKEVIGRLFQEMKSAGIRDFHFFSGSHCSSHQQRKEAFIECIENEGLDLHVYQVGTKEEDGYRFTKDKWLDAIQLSDAPSGLFCINDHVALGVSKALKEANIQIGQQVCLAGFGNVLPLPSLVAESWFTVEQHPYELGKVAMSALLSELEGRSKTGRNLLVPGEVISHP